MTGTRRPNGESTISATPNARGYYEAKVTMGTRPDGRADRRHVERKTLAAVRKRVRELERERDAGRVTKPGKPPTVQQMLDRHIDVLVQRGRAPRTIDDYRSKARNDIYPRWGGQRIDRLLPEHIEDGYAEMLAAGHAAGHVRKVHAILSSAYEVQVKRGNVARNPCRLVEPPALAQPELAAPTREQVRALLAEVETRRNSARWKIGLATGLRQGEALGLRWEFVDLEEGTMQRSEMRVWYQLQRLAWQHGCGDPAACTEGKHRRPCPRRCPKAVRKSGRRHVCVPADAPRLCPPGCTAHASTCPRRALVPGVIPLSGGLVLREIKERRRKTIPLAPELVTVLRAHKAAQARERLAAGNEWEDHGLVFAQPDGKPIDPAADYREWAGILRAAAVRHFGVHAMRHFAATFALDEGVALPAVQEMLGHSDIRVTRQYTHVSSPLAQDAAARIGRALFRPTVPETVPKAGEA